GICATTFCLTYGLIAMRRGDSRKQQLMMRGRVLAQGFTVMALMSGIMYSLVQRAKQSSTYKTYSSDQYLNKFLGICATTFCLTYGLIAMRRGDSRKQQLMMRGRVLAQGFTVMALLSGIMYSLVQRAKQSST
ncbi:unnamed protein product, partial [Oppiella nova]